MKVWMIWIQEPDAGGTWLEAAWTDDMTADNYEGWEAEVDRCRKMAFDNKYEMRIQEVEVPCVGRLFEIPPATATAFLSEEATNQTQRASSPLSNEGAGS